MWVWIVSFVRHNVLLVGAAVGGGGVAYSLRAAALRQGRQVLLW